MENSYLVATDFDGALANTFRPPPTGYDVNTATSLAIAQQFGPKGLKLYNDLGGMQNREPGELIGNLLQEADLRGIRMPSFGSAKKATEYFVDLKLALLLPQISREWPRLYPGVREFFQIASEGYIPIKTAVVSSGHDRFINRVFEVNGLKPPDYLVSSDSIRALENPKRRLYKPYPYQLALAHKQWLGTHKIVNDDYGLYADRGFGKTHMIYIGDDPIKDGELATKSRIPFGFVPFTHPDFHPDPNKGQFFFDHFVKFADLLLTKREVFERRGSFAEIIFNKPDHELFPALKDFEFNYKRFLERNGGYLQTKER